MFESLWSHWRARHRFEGIGDYATYLYDRLLRRAPNLTLPGRRQVTSVRLREKPEPFHVRLGATDFLVLEELFHTGEYQFVEKNLPNVRQIVDLGANVGFSLRYWNEVFPSAQILAVEPDASNCDLCQQNIAASQIEEKVTLVQACVGAYRRKVRLGGAEEWAYTMLPARAQNESLVEVIPMLELLNNYSAQPEIDLLKCDIEGAEEELFQNCAPWINRVKAIVIELHNPYSTQQFIEDLQRGGGNFTVVKSFADKQCPVLLLVANKSV